MNSGLQRNTPLQRKPMKRTKKTKDWSEARDKVEEEGRCRVCSVPDGSVVDGFFVHLEAAHTIGQKRQDEVRIGPRGGETLVVKRESVVPLCTDCHRSYDERRLDLLPFLFMPEQLDAVKAAGGIALANKRLSGNA